ncbi:hypothetical protein AA0482_0957 [Acetobacter cibinongensis NRIC 0482]|nr:hypothetical protein AA0482_0957 [Acetobacter cibinongensis NRIC 0482]
MTGFEGIQPRSKRGQRCDTEQIFSFLCMVRGQGREAPNTFVRRERYDPIHLIPDNRDSISRHGGRNPDNALQNRQVWKHHTYMESLLPAITPPLQKRLTSRA